MMSAATRVVAEQGLRGLTHRAVDREAGLSEGSCSAYYRTRRALQAGLTQYVASALAGDVTTLTDQLRSCPPDDDRAVDLTTRLFLRWLAQRDLLLARLELTLEATRDPELAALLVEWRARMVNLVAAIFAARGLDHSAERAEVLIASFDGVLLGVMARPVRGRKAFLSRSLELLMGSLVGKEHPLG
jgi:DNA-binding transcriptional regulator YbjK